MFKHVLASSVVILASVSSAFADRGDRGRGFDRGDRYSGGRSHSNVSLGFGFSSSNYRGGGSSFDIGFSSGRGYAPRYDSYCDTPSYYYAPRPVYREQVIVTRPRVYERPVYIEPTRVYVQPPVVYQPAPVVVYPSQSYYYTPCAPNGDVYYRSTTSYYYGR